MNSFAYRSSVVIRAWKIKHKDYWDVDIEIIEN